MTKKDRCLFLFNDMLVCATVKRKANALRRGSLSMYVDTTFENNRVIKKSSNLLVCMRNNYTDVVYGREYLEVSLLAENRSGLGLR